jgi:hypothetical protein
MNKAITHQSASPSPRRRLRLLTASSTNLMACVLHKVEGTQRGEGLSEKLRTQEQQRKSRIRVTRSILARRSTRSTDEATRPARKRCNDRRGDTNTRATRSRIRVTERVAGGIGEEED